MTETKIPLQGPFLPGAEETALYTRMLRGVYEPPEGWRNVLRLEEVKLGHLITKSRRLPQGAVQGQAALSFYLYAQMSGLDWKESWFSFATSRPEQALRLLRGLQGLDSPQLHDPENRTTHLDPPTLLIHDFWYEVTRQPEILLTAYHLGWDRINALVCRYERIPT